MKWGRADSGLYVPQRLASRKAQAGFFAMGPAFLGANGGPLQLIGAYTAGAPSTAYSQQLAITGGVAPYSLTGGTGLASGALPPGLSLSIVSGNQLKLSGTPTANAFSTFTVSVTSTDSQVATSIQVVVVIRGLLCAYPLNETSGLTAKDASGNGHDAAYAVANILYGQSTLLPSGGGKSIQLTGNTSITLPSGFLNAVGRPITIFGWGKSSNVTPGQQILASSTNGFNFYLGSGKMTAGVAGVANNIIDGRTLTAGTTYFWAVTINASGDATIFVNNVASGTVTAAFSSSIKFVDPVWIGNYPNGPTNNWFNGNLQNVGVCNVALTATEIGNLYANS